MLCLQKFVVTVERGSNVSPELLIGKNRVAPGDILELLPQTALERRQIVRGRQSRAPGLAHGGICKRLTLPFHQIGGLYASKFALGVAQSPTSGALAGGERHALLRQKISRSSAIHR